MKKVGKEVLFLSTSENNPRNGESSFARLSDGRIMHAYTEYIGDSREDHATARISVCYSSDEGETWTKPQLLLNKEDSSLNIMSVNLLKLANGELGLSYSRKDPCKNGYFTCMPKYRYSLDDGKTWSEEISCVTEPGYYINVNHRLIQLKNGRLLLPTTYHGNEESGHIAGYYISLYSDDNGRTWNKMDGEIHSPYDDKIGLQEPGVLEMDDGRLWVYFRTEYGHQYQAFSQDGGISWTEARPNFLFTSPNSPMIISKVKNYVVAIYNPIGYSPVNDNVWHSNTAYGRPKRTPFICAISKNGGVSFDSTNRTFLPNFYKDCVYIEDDLNDGYCYPAVIETKDGFLVSYYHSNGCLENCLNCTKITKITWDEIEL